MRFWVTKIPEAPLSIGCTSALRFRRGFQYVVGLFARIDAMSQALIASMQSTRIAPRTLCS
jgi:hypothetical protein